MEQAIWIKCNQRKGALPVFRKSFYPKQNILSATLYATALGVYTAYLNGEKIGNFELEPGSDEMAKRKSFTAYDVKNMLRAGEENVLSAVVGSGWWSGRITWKYGKEEAFLAELHIVYEGGEKEVIPTDLTWKSKRAAPVLSADFYDGESYDARIGDEWKFAGFDEKGWHHVRVNSEFSGEVTPFRGPHITVKQELERAVQSVVIYRGAQGADKSKFGKIHILRTHGDEPFTLQKGETALIDFGQNFSGWESFVVEGKRGTELLIEHGEMLNDQNGEKSRGNDGPGGSLYNLNYRSAKAATRYILRGEGEESYRPSFTYYGFRYIEITATHTVTVHKVTGQVVSSVPQRCGELQTSHPLLNQLISNVVWGMYSNYLSVPTDCPQRDERLGWTADTQVFAETACFLADAREFLKKYLVCMRDAQKEDGSFPGTAPTGSLLALCGESVYGGTGWADAGVMIPHTLWRMYGDTSVIEESWSSMQKYVDGYLGSTDGLGGKPIWGDWLSYESNGDEVREILGVAYYAWDAKLMAEMAEALGKAEEKQKYEQLFEREKAFFISRYVKNHRLIRGEQSVLIHALYLDLLPDEETVEGVKEQLTENLERNGNKLQTGFLGTKILLDTLTKIGRSDIAYSVLLCEENPSWLYSVLQGATTIWERWNSYTKESGFGDVSMNSFNHYAYGAVVAWMFRTMAGVSCLEAGFKKILFAPCPDKRVEKVTASYDSAQGKISVDSRIEEDVWHYSVSIPQGTSAVIHIPDCFPKVTVDGNEITARNIDLTDRTSITLTAAWNK